MDLERCLAEERAELVSKWLDLLLQTYPEQTQKLWRRNKDPFTNPVGHTFRMAMSELWDLVLEWSNAEAISEALDKIVRIRAIQDFSPSQALNFVYLLKRLIRERYWRELEKAGSLNQLADFETRLDNLALMAFDVYTKCREQVYEMRITEVKNAQHKLLVRAGMIADGSAGKAEEGDEQVAKEPSNQL